MSQMAISLILKKRARLLGQLDAHSRERERLREQVTALEVSLGAFGYEGDLGKAKGQVTPSLFQRGELRGVLMPLMGEPSTVGQLTERVIEAKGWEATRAIKGKVRRSVAKMLERMERMGLAEVSGKVGPAFLWNLREGA